MNEKKGPRSRKAAGAKGANCGWKRHTPNQILWRKANCFMATKTEYSLSEPRCASLRARLLQSNVDAIGLALKAGLISPDQAVEHLADCGVLRLLGLRDEQEAAA
jgi:hypothetical protein